MPGTTLGTAYVQIVPSAQGISGSITNLLAGEGESAGTSLGSKIGSFAKKALAAAAIGTAVVKITKSALDEGAKLQQSYMGGLDTLYGEAADSARAYAKEAAQAGISMNDYSEQAVSFGAALKNAYGGDTYKAMEAANTAILDMADNSAKMGTDIGSVQMAYQGFAKQNYTMLDNLKLGYGGTKTEMERLLADAEKLTGVHYDIDNLGDVYDAIHVIQGDLGLTGVAAAEASETFSGSFEAMKASASNFLGSLALGENVSGSLSQLMTSASTFFFGNFIPMIGTLVKSLPSAIGTFLQQGLPLLVSNVSTLLTSLGMYVSNIANNLSSGTVSSWASTTVPKILSAGGTLIKTLASAFIRNLPLIVSSIGQIGLSIVTGLGSALWGKVSAAAAGIRDRFMQPINSMRDKVKGIIDKIKGYFPFNLGKILKLQIPKINVSGGSAPWGIGGKGTKPSISISWESHAAGGIFTGRTLLTDGSTIHEFNEAGREAIVPLDPFWDRMDRIAESMQGSAGGVVVNVYGSPGMNVNELAQAVERRLIEAQNRRRLAWQ